jgi:hypothetical protein
MRLRATASGLAALAAAALLAACGGGSSSDANEPTGTYRVEVTDASFPALQRLGQTSLLRLKIRNSGDKTVPALTVTFTVAGKKGVDSSLPFGVRDPQAGLAQPDRPVWVLAQSYPRLAGSTKPGGATTSNRKTFDFGPLKPGQSTDTVWKLSAVREGKFTLLYTINAGLTASTKAVTNGGVTPGGSFAAEITSALPETEVTDSGEVVEIKPNKRRGGKGQAE